MEYTNGQFFVSWVRWQGKDSYLLWLTADEKDMYWPDADKRIPAFATASEVIELGQCLGVQVVTEEPRLQNLDAVWEWLEQPKKLPPKECLTAWHAFSDLSSGIQGAFSGDTKSPVRNRLFDKLYLNDGIFQINQHGRIDYRGASTKPWVPCWTLQERKVLKRVLQEGFRMWQKYVYWPGGNLVSSGT